jgi:glycosyltransferase involved in cell wall biosynthesis
MNKIKLLFFGDSCECNTGFSRVSQAILEGLYNKGEYDISILGINHPIGDPHRYEGMFKIYPASAKGNVYGFNRVEEVVVKSKPDVMIINNDLWVLQEYLKSIPAGNRIITYSPIDALPVQQSWIEMIRRVNAKIVVYTQFARNGILAVDRSLDIRIIGHGVDTDEFYPIEDARDILKLDKELFIVGNVNRNQPRKRLDLWLQGMGKWINSKSESERSKISIWFHGALKDVGWDLLDLSKRYGIDDRFMLTNQEGFTPAKGVPIQELCKIYSAMDLMVMTSMGEGYGLSPIESSSCCTANIVPNSSATKEIWEGVAPLINISHTDVLTGGINTEGKVIDINHMIEIVDDLYVNRDKLKDLGKKCYDYVQQEKFTWGYIVNQFDNLIKEVLNDSSCVSNKFEAK